MLGYALEPNQDGIPGSKQADGNEVLNKNPNPRVRRGFVGLRWQAPELPSLLADAIAETLCFLCPLQARARAFRGFGGDTYII